MSAYIAHGISQLWNSLKTSIDKGLDLAKDVEVPAGVPNTIEAVSMMLSKVGELIRRTIVALCVAVMVGIAVFVKTFNSDI